nr:hypothetical transcript [Hymenolepis microstoma]
MFPSLFSSENVKIVRGAINSRCSDCIDAYQELFLHFATGQLSIDELLNVSLKEVGQSPLYDALNNEMYQKRFEDILMSVVMTNNLASRKLAWLIKSVYPDSKNGFLGVCNFEGINPSSWIPELALKECSEKIQT